MGLEPMTSPLPRECSTTELHQHFDNFLQGPKTKGILQLFFILPRTQARKHDAEGKKR
jgi:hypothetical protein